MKNFNSRLLVGNLIYSPLELLDLVNEHSLLCCSIIDINMNLKLFRCFDFNQALLETKWARYNQIGFLCIYVEDLSLNFWQNMSLIYMLKKWYVKYIRQTLILLLSNILRKLVNSSYLSNIYLIIFLLHYIRLHLGRLSFLN